MDYLLKTQHPSTRANFDLESNAQWAAEAKFENLKVLRSWEKGDEGFVEFEARFKMKGASHIHREASRFKRDNGLWYFLDGVAS